MSRHTTLTSTIALMLLSFGLAAWSSDSVFDRLPRTEDEVTFLFQAKTIAEGQIIAEAPEHPEFFFMSFVIARDGLWFGKYPPGHPLVLSLGVLLDRPWIVNALAASAAVGLLVLAGRRFYDTRTALLAGLLLVLSPFLVLQSGSLLSHVVALCWVLLALVLVDVMRTRDAPLAALGAGAAGGMLLLTRPLTAVGIALPFIVLAVIDLLRRRPLRNRYLLAVAGATPFIVFLLVYNDVTTGHPLRTAYELWWPYDRIGFGPEYGVNGHDLDDAIRNTRSNLGDLGEVLFGWPRQLSLLPVALAAGVAGWKIRRNGFSRETSADLLLVGMFVGLIAVHMLYWTPGKMYGPRYYFEIIGALALLGSRGIIWLWDAAGDWLGRVQIQARWPRLAIPIAVAALIAYNLIVTLPSEADRYRGWNGVHREDLEAIQAEDLENALVFVPRPNWPAYAPLFLENSTTLDGDVIYAVDRGNAANRVLMRDFPERIYYRYRDGELSLLSPPGAALGAAAR